MTGKDRQPGSATDPAVDIGDIGDIGDTGDTGGFLRPDPMVLAEEALIPEHNIVDPPPTRFTHELAADEPYWYDRPRGRRRTAEPDGVLPAGTPVVLMIDGSQRSRVVDPQGRYVEVSSASLRELPGG